MTCSCSSRVTSADSTVLKLWTNREDRTRFPFLFGSDPLEMESLRVLCMVGSMDQAAIEIQITNY